MSEKNDKIDILSRMSMFHEDVMGLQRHTRRLLTFLGKGSFSDAAEQFHGFFRHSLVHHFAFEENVVFPAIRVWTKKPELIELISSYEVLHRNLLQEGTAVSEQLVVGEENQEPISVKNVAEMLARLSGNLLQHADHENTHIIPLLKTNSSLRFLIGRNYYLFKNEAQKYF